LPDGDPVERPSTRFVPERGRGTQEDNKMTHKKRVRRYAPASIPEFAQEPCVFRPGSVLGGRPKGAPNKATLEIKEFVRSF
jgi:hypothetical protein